MTKKQKKKDVEFIVQIAIIVVLVGILMFSLGRGTTGVGKNSGLVSASEIIPTGAPSIYGEELGISYDDVSPNTPQLAEKTIDVLANIDMSETLEGSELQRYIDILYNMNNGISCEYCCGARAVIFSDGSPACGCSHSYAMRGLAKYLIKYHGNEYTDEQILQEVAKWKVLFFPEIHEGKAQVLAQQGIDVNYMNLASNAYRGIEQGQASGNMVGDC